MLLLPFKVLVDGMLHRIDSLFEPRVPIVLYSIIGPSHKLFGYETPFLGALVPEDEENPLFLL